MCPAQPPKVDFSYHQSLTYQYNDYDDAYEVSWWVQLAQHKLTNGAIKCHDIKIATEFEAYLAHRTDKKTLCG